MLQQIRRTQFAVQTRRQEAQQNQHRPTEAGFTLIELLLVIVVLGILSAVVVFSVSGISDTGKAAACKADVASVNSAAEAYFAKNGKGATAIDDAGHTATTLVGAGFLHSAPSSTDYTIKWTAGGDTSAGGADSTECPS